jgi:hypothetical protein
VHSHHAAAALPCDDVRTWPLSCLNAERSI